MNFFNALGHTPGHDAAIFAHQHHRRAKDCFVAIFGGRASPDFCANRYICHVLHEDRRDARAEFQREIRNLLGSLHPPDGADDELLAAPVDHTATSVFRILTNLGSHFFKR